MAAMNNGDALSRIFSHVIQKKKSTIRTRKTAKEYAMEYGADLISQAVVQDGQVTDVLYCKFCCQSISSRSDRIKEHVKCKKHLMNKSKVIQAAIDGKTLSEEKREEAISGLPNEKKPLPQLVVKDNKKKSDGVIFHKAEDETKKEETVLNTTVPVQVAASSSENIETGVTIVDCKPEVSDSKSQLENEEGEQLLCVRWDNYNDNAIQMFSQFKELGYFADVTLWCEGTSIKCHKIVLSSCSNFFESILAETANHNNMYPIITLTQLRLWQVQALVHFMYNGEMSINREDLESLLHAASALGIKGLRALKTMASL